MLVLTRKMGEAILLPDSQVRITVLAIRGGRIQLGVTAPDSIKVLRAELSLEEEGCDGFGDNSFGANH